MQVFLELGLCIAFILHHIPSLLVEIQGFSFGFINVMGLLGLCLLEFFNLFTMISFIFALFINLLRDFVIEDNRVLLVQLKVSSVKIFKILIYNCFLYSFFFVANDLFIVPKSNFLLKKSLLEVYKNKIFYSIKPRYVINIPEIGVNVSIVRRVKNELIGCLIHFENYRAFGVIKKLVFRKDKLIELGLNEAKGKVVTDYGTFMFDINDGVISMNPDNVFINLDKKKIFSIFDLNRLLSQTKILLITILIAFFVFIFIFSKNIFFKIICLTIFTLLFLDSFHFIYLKGLIFSMLYISMIILFFRTIRCLNF